MRSDRLNIALAQTNNEVIVNHNNGFDLIRIGIITIAKKKADMIYKMNLYQQNKIIPISYNKTRGNVPQYEIIQHLLYLFNQLKKFWLKGE